MGLAAAAHRRHVAAPDGEGEGGGAVVGGQVHVGVGALQQQPHQVSPAAHRLLVTVSLARSHAPLEARAYERGVSVHAAHVDPDVGPRQQQPHDGAVVLLHRDDEGGVACSG